jgi:hypothetical protein
LDVFEGRTYRISMIPNIKQRNVVPESMRIILRQYLRHPEAKSLAPDGQECVVSTQGLLRRASIVAGEIVPVGKETDRRWEQGEDASLVDFKVHEFRKKSNMVVADVSDRKRWKKIGVRQIIRKSGLTQKPVYAIINRQPVRKSTLAVFRRAVDG